MSAGDPAVLTVIAELPERETFAAFPDQAKLFAIEWSALVAEPDDDEARRQELASAFEAGWRYGLSVASGRGPA